MPRSEPWQPKTRVLLPTVPDDGSKRGSRTWSISRRRDTLWLATGGAAVFTWSKGGLSSASD